MLRILKNGGASDAALAEARHFVGQACEPARLPKPPPHGTEQRSQEFNEKLFFDAKVIKD